MSVDSATNGHRERAASSSNPPIPPPLRQISQAGANIALRSINHAIGALKETAETEAATLSQHKVALKEAETELAQLQEKVQLYAREVAQLEEKEKKSSEELSQLKNDLRILQEKRARDEEFLSETEEMGSRGSSAMEIDG